MFEAYSETARHVIFFARLEAGRLACETIEPEHLVLGFISQDQRSGRPFLNPQTAARLRERLSTRGSLAQPMPTHGDMMLSDRAQQALASAHEHADGSPVTPLHLLLAVLSNDANPTTPCLIEYGVTNDLLKEAIRAQ